MKNILIIIITSLLFGCTQSSMRDESQNPINSSRIDNATMTKIVKEAENFLTAEEVKNLNSGNYKLPMIILEAPTYGVFADGISAFASKIRGTDEKTLEVSNLIIKNQNIIFVSYNTDLLLKSINHLSEIEEGRVALKNSKFIFANTSQGNKLFMSENKIKELSGNYGFKYRYIDM